MDSVMVPIQIEGRMIFHCPQGWTAGEATTMIRQLFCLDKGGLYDLRNFAVHNDTVIVTGKGYVYKNYEAKGCDVDSTCSPIATPPHERRIGNIPIACLTRLESMFYLDLFAQRLAAAAVRVTCNALSQRARFTNSQGEVVFTMSYKLPYKVKGYYILFRLLGDDLSSLSQYLQETSGLGFAIGANEDWRS